MYFIKTSSSSVKRFTWKLPFLLFVLVAVVLSVDAQKSCITPNNVYGKCVDHTKCSYFRQQLLAFGSHIPQEFIVFIKKSRCPGPNKKAIFVCCERLFIEQSTTAPPPTTVATAVNQQINARGIKILRAMRCGEIESKKIAHGNNTKLNEFTFMALLKYDAPEKYLCGGSVITNRFILTAAHCWVGQSYNLIGVRLGEHDYSTDMDCTRQGRNTFCNPPVEDYGIDKLIPHPLYKPYKIDHDIGLIRLDRDIIFKDKVHIQPICLPIFADTQKRAAMEKRYIIAGWGTTELKTTSTVLLKATIPHHRKDFCQKTFPRYTITDNFICAGGHDFVDSCIGDSGGPLFFQSIYNKFPRYAQYGVVSSGVISCGVSNYPTVYTRIISYLPWLTNAIAENE